MKMYINERTVKIYNTGGWLEEPDNGKFVFCGAEVFTCATGQSLSSQTVL
ncbi:MAG: hypothetical protein E3K37_12330 [Candidatus Kuenenia sp.]|nr:hypothetical protein [Candidatus Kuenenia hertensis]